MRLQHLPYLEYEHKFDTPVNINEPKVRDYWRIYKQYPWKLFDSVFTAGLRVVRNILTMVLPFIVSALVIKYGGRLILFGLSKLNEQYPLSWFDDFQKSLSGLLVGALLLVWLLILFYTFIRMQMSAEEDVRGLLYKDIWTPPVVILWERNRSGYVPHEYEFATDKLTIRDRASWFKYHDLSYGQRLVQSSITEPSVGFDIICKDTDDIRFIEDFIAETKRQNGLSEYAERLNVITEETDYGTVTWNLGNGTDDLPKKRNLKLGINH